MKEIPFSNMFFQDAVVLKELQALIKNKNNKITLNKELKIKQRLKRLFKSSKICNLYNDPFFRRSIFRLISSFFKDLLKILIILQNIIKDINLKP